MSVYYVILNRYLRASTIRAKWGKGKRDDIEFVEARKDAAKTFESAEQELDFVAPTVHSFVVLTRLRPIMAVRNHGNEN